MELSKETRKYIQDRLEVFSKVIHDNEDTGLGYAIMILDADLATDDMIKEGIL